MSNRVKVQITVPTSSFCSFSGSGYVNSETLKAYHIYCMGLDVTSSSNCSEKVGFASFFSTQLDKLNDVIPMQ